MGVRMKTENLLLIGLMGAAAFFLFKSKPEKAEAISSPAVISVGQVQAPVGYKRPAVVPIGQVQAAVTPMVEELAAQGKNNAQIANEVLSKITHYPGGAILSTGPGTLQILGKPSSVGIRFKTAGDKIGYASSAVTAIRSVPKEESIAYKLGYIK